MCEISASVVASVNIVEFRCHRINRAHTETFDQPMRTMYAYSRRLSGILPSVPEASLISASDP